MSLHVITFTREEHYIRKFLELPGRLYSRKELMQKPEEERQILTGTHILSHYFTIFPFLVLDENDAPVSRALLTVYPDDTDAFLGFFESEENGEAVALLFKKAEETARVQHCRRIVGPVDASFWIRYRFKVNCFDHTYTGEPCNKEYYAALWRKAGYEITEKYYSNHYRIVERSHSNPLYASRLTDKLQEGYRIVSPSKETFDSTLNEVYDLLIELYRSFPAYKRITREEFVSLYSYLKLLIRYPMVKMAYYQEKAVGFFISIPDYQNMVYQKLTPLNILRILFTRAKPKSYVMLYMGIDDAHHGLGKAMAEAIKMELSACGLPAVGALIRQGNINRDYFRELIDYEYAYVLLSKDLSCASAQHTAQHTAAHAQQHSRCKI